MLHTLSINQKSQRVSYSKLLLTSLTAQKASGSQRIIPGDELWFFVDYPRDLMWAASRDELPQRVKQKLTGKSAWFRAFGRVTESTIFLMCPKGQRTTQHCSLMLLCPS
jgi:hypothetical protein